MKYPTRFRTYFAILLLAALHSTLLAQPGDIGSNSISSQVARLLNRYKYAVGIEDWATAIDAGTKIHDLDPGEGVPAFNLARLYATLNDPKRAFGWIDAALDAGFSSSEMLRNDKKLASLRSDPRFLQALDRADEIKAKQFETLKTEFDNVVPLSFQPPDNGKNEPLALIIALHGFGVKPSDIAGAFINTASQTQSLLVCPAGPRPGGQGRSWRYEDESEWIVLRTLDRMIEDHDIDTSRIVLAGFSQGATVAYNIALKYPHLFQGVILISGAYDTALITAPDDLPKEDWPSFYLMAGSLDPLKDSARSARGKLQELGFDATYIEFEDVGHSLPDDYDPVLTTAAKWVQSH